MKKIMVVAATALFLSAGAQAATISMTVSNVKLGNQFTQGGGGTIPDVNAVDWGVSFVYDTDTQILAGTHMHQSGASQSQYKYTADWVIDLAAGQLNVLSFSCQELGGSNPGCTAFTTGIQPGAVSVLSGNINDPTVGAVSVIKWMTGGAPFGSAFVLTELTVVPVPAAVWLFASALGIVGFLRRRVSVA